ncbi:MAG: hypothetical protein QE271_05530 [Bacteriovoracaceae bacterium]|nr:hypothetical protein [Bacteriovoracaceae bacterium]
MARWFVWVAMISSVAVITLVVYFSIPVPHLMVKRPSSEKLTKIILLSVNEVQQLWTKGDYRREIDFEKSHCPEMGKMPAEINREYLRCNPHFLQCYFTEQFQKLNGEKSSSKFKIAISKTEKWEVEVSAQEDAIAVWSTKKRVYRTVARSLDQGEFVTPYGIAMEIYIAEISFSYRFILENLCHQTYLPEQKYDYGQTLDQLKKKMSKDLYENITKQTQVETPRIWDNRGRFFTIDKFLVTQQDYNEFLWFQGKENQIQSNAEKWPFPVTNLTQVEMKDFCHFRGKRPLTAALYDANVFFRKPNSENQFELISRNQLFPQSPKGLNDKTKKAFSMDYASWMGTFQWKDHYFEAVENAWDPTFNLSTFSLLLPADHPWNHIAYRTGWNGKSGEGSKMNSANSIWGMIESIPLNPSKVEIAFRCYQEFGEFF